MYLDDKKYKSRTKTWMRLIIITLVIGFLLTFRREMILLVRFLWGLFRFLLGRPLALDENTLNAIVILVFNGVIFGIAFLIMAYIVASQALVPVSSSLEKRRTTWHLILHMLRLHGPAIFVQSGKIIQSEEDKIHKGPGLIAIDYNSAVVLEEQLPDPIMSLSDIFFFFSRKSPKDKVMETKLNVQTGDLDILDRIGFLLGIYQPYQSPRAVGAGITFTRPRERIRGWVDLRKQSRSLTNVRAYTRDGIEITTNIWALFTIGEKPEVLDITYDGEIEADNLRVIRLKKDFQGELPVIKIESLQKELDKVDRDELHAYTKDAHRSRGIDIYREIPQGSNVPIFDPQRVFAAVFSEARGKEDSLVHWVDLPTSISVDIFRELISKYNYNQLYQPDQPAEFPISNIRRDFRTLVRNTGVLSCRLVFHKTRRPLISGTYDPNDLRISEVYDLRNQKILRERGIKLVACGFTDLIPPEEVYKQRLDNWRARWEKETRVAQSVYELEAMRVQNRARLQTQQELRYEFLKILQATEYPREVLALRILQALENAAADPRTKQLLPGETLQLMKHLDTMINR